MTSDQLRALQAPLKEKYKQDPGSALITLEATGKLGEGVACHVNTWSGKAEAGLHWATGGSGLLACSGDMLLQALVACAGVTLGAIASALNIEIADGQLRAEGDLDFRGTLGVSKEAKVGFRAIRLYFTLKSNASQAQLESLEKLTERYCVVYQTLVNGVSVECVYKHERA